MLKKPEIYRRTGKDRYSIVIGHGCSTTSEMIQWCDDMNAEFKERIYSVHGLRSSMTLLEVVMCEKALGLDQGKVVTRNRVSPSSETELNILCQMVAQDWMRPDSISFIMTQRGLTLFDQSRKINIGEIG